ncbi:hypothetical protein [Pedobacter sp. WC2423]|uniref:hypothetical protein n=1 Tax=Pedobacter sp. WC2423 TaxID=3234142 RepID=UPI003465314C
MKKLHAEGASIKSIARKFKMYRTTIRKYIAAQSLPRHHYNLPTQLEKSLPYIVERLMEEAKLLLRNLLNQLKELGYTGAYSLCLLLKVLRASSQIFISGYLR